MRVEKCFKQLAESQRACQCVGWASLSLAALKGGAAALEKGPAESTDVEKNTYRLETAQVILHRAALSSSSSPASAREEQRGWGSSD